MSDYPLISVIVPVYNVEPYIRKCVDSILAQTYETLEIILVDDGSTDASGSICDAYASLDTRIRVLHRENGGLSAARNTGMAIASGTFMGFVDSDDWILPTHFELLLRPLLAGEADISVCAITAVDEANREQNMNQAFGSFSADEAMRLLLRNRIWNYAWSILTYTKFYEGIRFPEGRLYEDILTTYRLFVRASAVYAGDTPTYCYLRRSGSITKTATIKNGLAAVEARIDRSRAVSETCPQYRIYTFAGMLDSGISLSNAILLDREAYPARRGEITKALDYIRENRAAVIREYDGKIASVKCALLLADRLWAYSILRVIFMQNIKRQAFKLWLSEKEC